MVITPTSTASSAVAECRVDYLIKPGQEGLWKRSTSEMKAAQLRLEEDRAILAKAMQGSKTRWDTCAKLKPKTRKDATSTHRVLPEG